VTCEAHPLTYIAYYSILASFSHVMSILKSTVRSRARTVYSRLLAVVPKANFLYAPVAAKPRRLAHSTANVYNSTPKTPDRRTYGCGYH
jgi:hypothetical protein